LETAVGAYVKNGGKLQTVGGCHDDDDIRSRQNGKGDKFMIANTYKNF
jgi:hypothetical protein